MTETWNADDVAKIGDFTVTEYCDWLRRGLIDWDNVRENRYAFEPLRDRFNLRDDPEPQIAEMFDVMSERQKQTFLRAISMGFSETETTEHGLAFFDSLQRLVMLINRPEPIEPMVQRLSDSELLENANESVSQHLYARGFYVIEKLKRHRQALLLMAKLLQSERFKSEYGPAVLSMLSRIQPAKLFSHLLRLNGCWTFEHITLRAEALLTQIIPTMSAVDLLEAVRDRNFLELKENWPDIFAFLKKAAGSVPNALTSALLADAAAAEAGRNSDVDRAVIEEYETLPDENRWAWRELTGSIRCEAIAVIKAVDPERLGIFEVGEIGRFVQMRYSEGAGV
jgi:hypothetical protein